MIWVLVILFFNLSEPTAPPNVTVWDTAFATEEACQAKGEEYQSYRQNIRTKCFQVKKDPANSLPPAVK